MPDGDHRRGYSEVRECIAEALEQVPAALDILRRLTQPEAKESVWRRGACEADDRVRMTGGRDLDFAFGGDGAGPAQGYPGQWPGAGGGDAPVEAIRRRTLIRATPSAANVVWKTTESSFLSQPLSQWARWAFENGF